MDDFTLVGARPPPRSRPDSHGRGLPLGAMLVLAVIVLGCLPCGLFFPRDPTYMDLGSLQRGAVQGIPLRHGRDGPRHSSR